MYNAQVGTRDAHLSFVLVLAHKHAKCIEGIYVKILWDTKDRNSKSVCSVGVFCISCGNMQASTYKV